MNILLSTSTAATPTGLPTQKKLFRVPKGAFTGRLIALYARTSANLAFTFADAPYTSWSSPANFVSESDDLPFDAVMDDDGNIHVVYTQTATGALRSIKLTYANGNWTPESAVTIYDSAASTNETPTIIRDAYGRLWVAWVRDDSGTVTLRVKFSTDDGGIWGSGDTDAGTNLSGTVTNVVARLIARPTYLHCLYTVNGSEARHRKIDLEAALWDAADLLYSGAGLDDNITGAVAPDGRLGALFLADDALHLKEFDGNLWGAIQTVVNQPCYAPSLRYIGLTPYAIFLQPIGTAQNRLYESHRSGLSFTSPAAVLTHQSTFASVFCHDSDAPTPFADLTAEAASTSGADILHPTSGALLEDSGDALYLGGEDRFSFIRILLSQSGAGGTVAFHYWNGNEWSAFTPDSGTYDFSGGNTGVRLFADLYSSPIDWQKSVINSANRYWIRILCTSDFSTTPIGSQITAVPRVNHVTLV